MNKCFEYKYISFNRGILDNLIDAVYIVLLNGSKRAKFVYQQIYDYKLSKNNFIQINESFKNCYNNTMCKQTVGHHLINNNINILKHANEKNYNNILVFEDDFILDPKIKNKKIIKNLEDFINNNNFNLYFLGVIPIMFNSVSINHMKLSYFLCTHSVIYSKSARNLLIKTYEKNSCLLGADLDGPYFQNLPKKYMYKSPLCFQNFPQTENRKNWDNLYKNFVLKIFELEKRNVKKIKRGFENIYLIIYSIHLLIIILFIYFIYIIFKKYIFYNKVKINL
tara:strand:- start:93 stop:932 length:840 start_codon:yes stop_codon:yes gene_type:complete